MSRKLAGTVIAMFAVCLCVGLLLSSASSDETPKDENPPAASDPKPDEKVDFTAEAREMNSEKFAPPPTEFRTGHVTPRELDAGAVTASETGYTIQLPSGAPIPTPTVYDGKLYASGGFHSKEYYCFDAATGKLVWGMNLDDDGPTSAVISDGVVVFNTESCTIFALDAETGKMLWSYWLGDPLTSTPTIDNGVVFTSYPCMHAGGAAHAENKNAAQQVQQAEPANQVEAAPENPGLQKPAGTSHVLAAIELKSGKILWQRWLDSDVMSAPVAVDGELYATSFAGTVYRFKQKDGTIISAERCRATSAPVIVGKEVYLTQRADSGNGEKAQEKFSNVDRDSNKVKAESTGKDAKYLDVQVQNKSSLKGQGAQLDAGNGFAGGAPATANAQAGTGNIGQDNVSTLQAFQGSRVCNFGGSNFSCMGDELVCIDPTTGKNRWAVKLEGDLEKEGGFLGAPPAAAGGQVFVATLKGEVLQLEPDKGKINKRYAVGSPVRFQPVIQDGRIFVGTQDGKLVCLNTGDAKLTGWTHWGGNAAHTGLVEKKAE